MTPEPLCVSESVMLAWLCVEVKKRYPKVRFPNPDYRVKHFYGEQWRRAGRVSWWKKGGDLEPILVVKCDTRRVDWQWSKEPWYYFDPEGIDPRWVKKLTEET